MEIEPDPSMTPKTTNSVFQRDMQTLRTMTLYEVIKNKIDVIMNTN